MGEFLPYKAARLGRGAFHRLLQIELRREINRNNYGKGFLYFL